MAPVQVKLEAGKLEVGKCITRDRLIFAFLLAVNRMNDDCSRVDFAQNPVFREEALMDLEQSRGKCHQLRAVIVMHCLSHRC